MPQSESGLNYTEQGSGDPVVLLDWTPWQTSGLVEALADKYRVFSVEPPGAAAQTGSMQEAAVAVIGVAESAGLSSFTLVGASLGADVSFRMALQRPASVPTMVLVSPTCVAPGQATWGNTAEMARKAMLAHPEDLAIASPDSSRTAVLAGLAERWRTEENTAIDMLPELSAATLVVFGQEDRLVASEAGGLWKGRVPNCSISYVYDAGHAIGVDRPDALADVVLDFVERRETFIVEKRSSVINP